MYCTCHFQKKDCSEVWSPTANILFARLYFLLEIRIKETDLPCRVRVFGVINQNMAKLGTVRCDEMHVCLSVGNKQ